MRALTIKNVPDDLYDELKLVAKANHRSIDHEVIVLLKRRLLPVKIPAEIGLETIRALRSQVSTNIIAPEHIEEAINKGRR